MHGLAMATSRGRGMSDAGWNGVSCESPPGAHKRERLAARPPATEGRKA